LLRILGIATLVALPRTLYVGALRGLERMEFNNIIDVSTMGLQQIGTIVILALGGGLRAVAYWLAACFALGIVAYIIVSSHFFSFSALIPGFSLAAIKRNLGYASSMVATSFLAMIHRQVDKALVSKLLPVGVFGYYGLAYSAVSRGTLVTGAISQAAFPSFSVLFKTGGRGNLMSQYRRLQDLFCFATVPLFAAIPFAAVPLFTYLLDAEAARMLLLPTTLLCVGFYMNGTLNVPYVFSLAAGRPDIGARLNFYALFVVLPVTIVLVYFYGINGAGFSWVFYNLFAYAYSVPRICVECLKISTWTWYVHLLRVVALIGGTYGLAAVLVTHATAFNVQSRFMAYSLASVAFLSGAYLLMGEELRRTLAALLLNVTRAGTSQIADPLSAQSTSTPSPEDIVHRADRTEPLVSIGMPTYNRAHFLAQAIDSVLAQAYSNFEIIISDNASPDNTEAICREYVRRDPRIRYMRQESNVGPARNFEEVLRPARGEYFAWLADDDWLERSFIQTLLSELAAHPDAVLCTPGIREVDADGKALRDLLLERIYPNVPWEKARFAFFENPSSSVYMSVYGLYRTSILKVVGTPQGATRRNLVTSSETPFLARLATVGRIIAIPDVLKYCRRHENSLCRSEGPMINNFDLLKLRVVNTLKLISIVTASRLTYKEKLQIGVRSVAFSSSMALAAARRKAGEFVGLAVR
jgi:glycosyltransferase involved in cell wall biosynthesis/O-antigen/teichoic acid export membrane protein